MEHYKNKGKTHKTTVTKCKNCGTEFLAKSTLAKFCGSTCKQANFLGKELDKSEKQRKTIEETIKDFSDQIDKMNDLKKSSNLSTGEVLKLEDIIRVFKLRITYLKNNK